MSLPQLTDEQKANVKNFWYIPVIIVCLIFMYISFKYGTYHPDPQSKIVMEMVDKLLAEKQKNYETTINYGFDVNYMIYNYLLYFQLTKKQQLGGFVPRI